VVQGFDSVAFSSAVTHDMATFEAAEAGITDEENAALQAGCLIIEN